MWLGREGRGGQGREGEGRGGEGLGWSVGGCCCLACVRRVRRKKGRRGTEWIAWIDAGIACAVHVFRVPGHSLGAAFDGICGGEESDKGSKSVSKGSATAGRCSVQESSALEEVQRYRYFVRLSQSVGTLRN